MDFNIEQYLKELETIVNIDSFTYDVEGVNEVVAIFEEKYKELGMRTERVFNHEMYGDSLFITNTDEDEYDFLLCGHLDTVFKKGTAAERPFKIENGRAYGPGVADMQSGALSMYYIVKNLPLDENGKAPRVCVLYNSHEEVGSTHSTEWMKEYAAKSKYGFVFEAARGNGEYVNERRGIIRFNVDIFGKPAHSGNDPENGINASKELGHWITEISKFDIRENGTSINFGKIHSDNPSNIICDHVKFDIDVRLSRMDERDKVMAFVENLAKNPFIKGIKTDVNVSCDWAPFNACTKAKEMAAMINELSIANGQGEAKFIASGGGSDANTMAITGLPMIDGCGPSGFLYHGPDEFLVVDSIEPKVKIMVELIEKLYAMK